jgi:two-component system sensor histidine kinase DegS
VLGRSEDGLTSALVLQAYETERARLARDLHDGPVQGLANAIFRLQYCETLLERDPAGLRAALGEIERDLRESLGELRRGIRDLRPSALEELGLAPTLRHYCDEFGRHHGLAVRVDLAALDERLPPEVEVALFRIVQEALHNVRKHAGASRARVAAARRAGALVVRVEDNGRGFDPALAATRETFGLTSMRERAALIGADLAISPRRGGGTAVVVRVPAARLASGRQ